MYGFGELTPFLDGLDTDAYLRAVGRAIVGDHDPAEVVLLEIEPERQKTRPDFTATEQLWGVRAIDISRRRASRPAAVRARRRPRHAASRASTTA